MLTFSIKAGAMISFMLDTAILTPLPRYLVASLSRNSSASWIPVLAPEGTAALNNPEI